ncbi:MAG: CocE/NonD family hydrolase [Pseudomonadales bacterium]|nr:CocE/NonD family hydrolase [Pseudomonadales bacterium]
MLRFRSLFLVLFWVAQVSAAQSSDYSYVIEDDWITLPDGVRLSVTYYKPEAKQAGETFPVLLEMLPYRKDDISKTWAHPYYDYFARQGLALAKVDVRGTGSSEGIAPTREYSDTEITDAIDVIASLAGQSWSNGNVGMWGISWGGFNAIQVALRNPPQLKAIIAAHASDDLYMNDVHYTDGVFGLDEYVLSINHMMGFMQSPDYTIDDNYFANRFDREPWLFNYLRHNQDGEFWREGSLKHQFDKVQVPMFLINGLLDGYRDTAVNSFESLDTPIRAVVGPWPHAWPNSATPGPSWEWREEATQWWKHWLADSHNDNSFNGQNFRFFLRSGNPPGTSLEDVAGTWYDSSWPLPSDEMDNLMLYPNSDGLLTESVAGQSQADVLELNSTIGHELGEWWGELLPDMRSVDAHSLVYDGAPLAEALQLVGKPQVTLRVSTNSEKANWLVRLEDVAPNGEVTAITGASLNGQLRFSSLTPQPLPKGEQVSLEVPLHFTTWTFKAGHRVRLAISNGLFPMAWPSPEPLSSTLTINSEASWLQLPLWEPEITGNTINMPSAVASASLDPQLASFEAVPGVQSRNEVITNKLDDSVSIIRESAVGYRMRNPNHANDPIRIHTLRSTEHKTYKNDPANTEYRARAEYRLLPRTGSENEIHYVTEINLTSDTEVFDLNITRTLSEGDQILRQKNWQETLPRGIH